MSTFNPAPHTFKCALLQPMHSLFNMRQCAGVGFTRIRPLLKRAKSVSHNSQQYFMSYTIYSYPIFGNWAVLE